MQFVVLKQASSIPDPSSFSSLSALWHTEQLDSNTSFPFSALPAFCPNIFGPAIISAKQPAAIKLPRRWLRILIIFSLQSRLMALQIGDRAPAIHVGAFQLSKLRGRRVVLFFFPKSDTPGCTKEACEFRDASKKFTSRETEIVGISPDETEAQQKFAAKYDFRFTFVPDPDHVIAEAYGVWKEKNMYGREVYVLRPSGPLSHRRRWKIEEIFPKVKPEGHAAQVLEAIGRQ